ncbi:MAG: hypothetical protein R3D55_09235 [Chloroflexota bacterium]
MPQPPKDNDKGKAQTPGSNLIAAVPTPEDAPLYLLTSQRLLWLENGRPPLDDSSKTAPLLKLHKDETVLSVITVQFSPSY